MSLDSSEAIETTAQGRSRVNFGVRGETRNKYTTHHLWLLRPATKRNKSVFPPFKILKYSSEIHLR